MGKSASTLPAMVLTLLIITAVAGTSLGFIYKLTQTPIAEAAVLKQQEAIRMVVPEFDNDPASEMYELTSEEGFTLKVFRSEEHTSELQSRPHLVCRLLLEKKKPSLRAHVPVIAS